MLAQASCRVIGVPYNSAVQSRSALPVTPARCSLVLTPLRCHRARQITAPRVRRSLAIVQASSAIAAPVPSQYGKLGMPLYQIMHLKLDSTWLSIVHYTHPWGVPASLLCRILRCGVAPRVPPTGPTRLTFLPTHVWLPAGYFMASVAFTAAVLQWMVFKVAAARKAAGVKYPAMTSYDRTPEAAAFNCTQRVCDLFTIMLRCAVVRMATVTCCGRGQTTTACRQSERRIAPFRHTTIPWNRHLLCSSSSCSSHR